MKTNQKKTVLITGASSGIGKETALFFHNKGWNVVATMRHPGERQTELHPLKEIRLLHLDVLDADSIRKAIDTAVKEFGGIDVLVNNAGYAVVGPFEAATKAQIVRQFNTNVLGLMDVTKEIIPHFRKQKNGVIVNIASIGGRITFPLCSLYHGTKWAVEGFSESLHYELRPFNIRVKIIEPGFTKTEFFGGSMDLTNNENLSMYENFTQKVFQGTAQMAGRASHPGVVAETTFTAATDNSFRLRYAVGQNARPLLLLRRLLPDAAYLALIRRASTR